MALEFTTNLKLIKTARTTIPTTTELPLGFMAFGVVNGKPSIWGNYDNSVHDLLQEGQYSLEIVQVTGASTTAIMSQNAVTLKLNALNTDIEAVETVANEAKTKADNLETTIDSLGTAATLDVGTGANNIPQLDPNGKLPSTTIPATVIVDTFVVSSEAEMLALPAHKSDLAVRTDVNKTFILRNEGATTLSNWQELLTPTNQVRSVNGKTGVVTLFGADIATTFQRATSRTNIISGERLNVTLGKVEKWFADLGTLAFKDTVDGADITTGRVDPTVLPFVSNEGSSGIINNPSKTSGLAVGEDGDLFVLIGSGLEIAQQGGTGYLSLKAGDGIRVDDNGVSVDVVLTIATI